MDRSCSRKRNEHLLLESVVFRTPNITKLYTQQDVGKLPDWQDATASTSLQTSMSSLNLGNLFDVKDKVVVITGGGRGIGKMMADGFVQNGAKVYIASRNLKACQETT
jgi:3-oxoacyl-ACP reductase-like protein